MSDFIRQNNAIQTEFSAESGWVLLSAQEAAIKRKIEAIGTPLKNWDINIYRGILTGFNEAFIINRETRDSLIKASPKNAEIIRPILRGKDIHRYYTDNVDQWVIYIPWHFPLHEDESIKGSSAKAEKAFKENYPDIYNHLLSYRKNLENRNKAETGIRYEWYALQRYGSNYWRDFDKKKIVWGNLSLQGSYTLVPEGVYVNAPSAFIPTDNLYLLAILNSKIADFYIQQLGVSRSGGYFEYKPMFVEQLPVPIISETAQLKFSKLVLEKLKETPGVESEVDHLLDEMACEIFGLSDEEKNYIYNFASSTKEISS
jgi:hypothetical protein